MWNGSTQSIQAVEEGIQDAYAIVFAPVSSITTVAHSIPVVLGKILNSYIEDNYICEGVDLLFVSFLLCLLSSNLLIC